MNTDNPLPSKPFIASKINWLGILTAAAGLGGFAHYLPDSISKYLLAASGIAVILLRTFGTSTTINGVAQ